MADQPASLAAALAELQTQLPKIGKTAEAQYGNYADLAAITREVMPKMGALGLSFIARPTLNENGQFVLLWSLLHASGEHESGQYPLPGMEKGPQALGSAITYARRYALCAVTGVAPDDRSDDDGQAAEAAHDPGAETSPNGGRWMNRRPDLPPADLRDKITPGPRPGPELEQLRDGTVEASPDDRPAKRVKGQDPDGGPWQDQPPGTFEETPPEERTGSIDGRQRSQIFAKFAILGITDATTQRETLAGILRRPVSSRASLSYRDAEAVLKDLQGRVEAKEAAEAAQQAAAEQDAAEVAAP